MTTLPLEEPEFCPSGFATVMVKLPPPAASTAVTAAFSAVALMKVVANGVPFQDTTLPLTKPVPLICRLKAPELAGTVAGETPATAGGAAAVVEGFPPADLRGWMDARLCLSRSHLERELTSRMPDPRVSRRSERWVCPR